MMALNIAVPMSGVGDLLEGFGLLSPISPVSIGFRSSIKTPLSPVGSESSGVSSLDLDDLKKQIPSSPTLPDENEEASTSASGPEAVSSSESSSSASSPSSSLSAGSTISTTSSRTCSTSSSASSSSSSTSGSDDDTNQSEEHDPKLSAAAVESPDSAVPSSPSPTASVASGVDLESNELAKILTDTLLAHGSSTPLLSPRTTKEPIFSLPRQSIYYNNRDILDLGSNLRWLNGAAAGDGFVFQYAVLPETNNIQFFLKNRSQYHRLGPNGYVQEFRMASCTCCDFKYPVNATGAGTGGANPAATAISTGQPTASNAINLPNLNANQIYGNLQLQQQQQLQQHQQQQQRLRLQQQQQQQQQLQYAYRNGANGGMGRDYTMYNQQASVASGMGQSSRFNNGVYGSGASSPNAGTSGGGGGGFYNNAPLGGAAARDQQLNNQMASMVLHYNSKGISQSNGGTTSQQSTLRQQYDMIQQQKQFVSNNYQLGAGNSSTTNTTATARLQQQQQQQQSTQYYKKNQTMRYGGASAAANSMLAAGPNGSSWKNQMPNNNTIQDTATKLFMELNKMQQQQQQQQQSPYYVPFL